MAINDLQGKFLHELGDIYDAEHQFLKAQQDMLSQAGDPALRELISNHIEQTRRQIHNVEQAFRALGQEPKRVMCDGAKGIVSEGQKLVREVADRPELCDAAIAAAAAKVEHYEIATYRGLITGAEIMGQREVVSLLQQNLEQEESTARLIEQAEPQLLRRAMGDRPPTGRSDYSQASPTY